MKNNKSTNLNDSSAHNQINFDTVIVGNIKGKGNYRIDGQLEGNIETTGKVVLGEKGKIIGNLNCGEAVIIGTVQGSVYAMEIISLKKTAIIEGEIKTNKLSIEIGANLNGNCQMKKLNTKNKNLITEERKS